MSYPKVIVEADGGSRGNPGPAGYGAVVFDADHVAVLAERRESVGIATNNVAEYRGLIAGLEAAAELGARTVDVRMDSKLVVEQMSGRWKVKHAAMIPLADRARRLVAGFDAVTFTWIPRAQNAHADRLANEAMDDAAVVEEVRTARDAGHAPTDLGAHRGAARPGPAAGEGAAALPDSGTADTRVLPDTPADPAPGWTGATGRPTRLLLLRHGQTELSVQRRYSGRGNPPLTELGREQAARAAKMLAAKGGIAAVITSPLGRARQTAEAAAAALGVDVQTDDGLIETDFGEWEGLTFREAAERDPELHAAWLGDPSVPAPGGESFDQVRARVEAARRDLVALYPGRNLVVVSHVTPIKTLLQLALGVGPSLLYRLHLDLASLSIAEFYPDGGSSVRLVNDTSYLA
ncbi:bifunctional RNase H/acid phosphatase [Nocardia farcinica]|uniref:bifunctional RNase H/acid phosphatase n=1 Tax=Nocardia TaxID=1817 RepID=UPI000BF0683D|nr:MULTISPECIES: bifunctional RNase H/acid phosphatase [Nocardia]MBF6068098.1 bifunctional RNase H/acid phosphatase [Nocardia farcinica]MBF6143539.1 bifunctional RNase H/acid phosphatase [Nocardia farcinica]MBF6186458.1 bifunctional RNase H/acid phosphatase [Nocardia farcinica]MBF6254236.1 bifunctional RNase H/acid phosphatase [Nocardia farcinica]MBF6259076.1 bifunctional RNase H/acid phosphatase [Nocardia farcinica]